MGLWAYWKSHFPTNLIFQTGRRTEINAAPSEKKWLSAVLFRAARTGCAIACPSSRRVIASRLPWTKWPKAVFFPLALRLFRCSPLSESETSGGRLFFQQWNNQPEWIVKLFNIDWLVENEKGGIRATLPPPRVLYDDSAVIDDVMTQRSISLLILKILGMPM